MNPSLLRILRCPGTGEPLDVHSFVAGEGPSGETDIRDGLLVSRQSRRMYAVQDGVPIMFEGGLPREFANRHAARIAEIAGASRNTTTNDAPRWSFSSEWSTEAELGVERTWGFTVESRVEQMLLEIDRQREWFRGKLLLDAGCGNGRLTDAITGLGAETIGIDFSDSVVLAHARRRSPHVHYVRGDLQRPPFAPETFDVVVSNGVLHHTPNTERTFKQIAPCVKPDGAFYVWLYARPERFLRRYMHYGAIGGARRVVSRLPSPVAGAIARVAAYAVRAKRRLAGQPDSLSFDELVISLLDGLTPRWQHYHTPIEVARWYFDAGFGAPTITHWDNPWGFGVVATKGSSAVTPGVHFDEQSLQDSTLSKN